MEDDIVDCHIKGVRPFLMNAFGSEELESQVFVQEELSWEDIFLVPPGTLCRITFTTKGLRHDRYEETLLGLWL